MVQTNAGANGTTTSTGVTEFPCNGATSGANGGSGTIPPPPIIIAAGDTICSGQSAVVTATSTNNQTIFWYIVPVGGTPVGSGNSYTTPPLTANTMYYLAVCPGFYRDSVEVIITPPPVASFTATTNCFNNATLFSDLSTGAPVQWSWNFGDGNTSTQQNPSHTYNSAGTYTASLIVTNSSGCTDTFSLAVLVNPLPVTSFSSTTVCVGNSTCFTDLSSIPSGNINSWSWNFSDPNSGPSNISNIQNPCHIFSTSGNYNVILTVTSNNGCQSTATLPATVTLSPAASFTVANGCMNSPTIFTDGSTGATQWNWNFGDGGISTSQNPSHTYLTSGTYSVMLVAGSGGACVDTVLNVVTIYPVPVVNFTADTVCLGNPTTFTDLSFISSGTISSWSWDFSGGITSTQQNPSMIFATSGTHSVTLIVTSSNGCSASVTHSVFVYDFPIANFSMDPGTPAELLDQIQFTDLSTGTISSWTWDFGDNTNSSLQNPAHLYGNVGTYSVMLIVESPYGCKDTAIQTLDIHEYSFYIPNAFTPNEDGNNEFFFGKGIGILEYEMWIFDRWGNEIFNCHVNDLPQTQPCQWGGKVKKGNSDKVVQEDVYVWKAKIKNIFGKEYFYTGVVTVVK